ncbi:MAG: MFS transporter [Gemmataceae bacterium]
MGEQQQPTYGRTVIAGVIGNVLEWYDFALVGFLAPVIAPLFFPSENRLAALLNTYGVFALGFLMRPVGGVLFGHIGDRLGRKTALFWSVALMAGPTTLVAFLPTYSQVGLAAPILLTLIRMMQGLSVGGEYIGSMSFLSEHAPPGRRGFLGSFCSFSAGLGNLLGSAVAALLTLTLPEAEVRAWGWRLPFLGGLGVGLVGIWLRQGVEESPAFKASRAQETSNDLPVFLAVRRDWRAILLTAGLAQMLGVGFYLPWVWLSTWVASINTPPLPLSSALLINTVAMSVNTLLIPLGGWLSDRVGRTRVLTGAGLSVACLSYPLFLLLHRGEPITTLEAQLALALLTALFYGPASAAFVELFPTSTRFTGIALGYNVTQAILGGTTPLVATYLIEVTHFTIAPAFYLMWAALCGSVCSFLMTDRTGQVLR